MILNIIIELKGINTKRIKRILLHQLVKNIYMIIKAKNHQVINMNLIQEKLQIRFKNKNKNLVKNQKLKVMTIVKLQMKLIIQKKRITNVNK